jgi:hypothetical protein
MSKYPNYKVYQNLDGGAWLWLINLSHKTVLECNWQYRSKTSALASVKRNFNKMFKGCP